MSIAEKTRRRIFEGLKSMGRLDLLPDDLAYFLNSEVGPGKQCITEIDPQQKYSTDSAKRKARDTATPSWRQELYQLRANRVYPETDEARFVRLVGDSKRLVYSIINSYDFIKEHERDDYYQEAVAYAWERFHCYDPSKSSFVTWMYTTTRWAIFSYRRVLKRDRSFYTDAIAMWFAAEDIPYDESHIESLKKAIGDLPPAQQVIVNMYLEGENFQERSLRAGKKAVHYSAALYRIRKYIQKHKSRWFEGIRVHEDKKPRPYTPSGKTNELSPVSKAIEQRDMNGTLIKSYPSMKEATRQTGIDNCQISEVCNGKGVHAGGFRWNFAGETRAEILFKVAKKPKRTGKKKPRPIEQLSLTGELIYTWPSVLATAKGGFTPTAVRMQAMGRINHHKGFKWRYADITDKNIC